MVPRDIRSHAARITARAPVSRCTRHERASPVAGSRGSPSTCSATMLPLISAVPSRHYVDPQVPLEDVLARQVVGGP